MANLFLFLSFFPSFFPSFFTFLLLSSFVPIIRSFLHPVPHSSDISEHATVITFLLIQRYLPILLLIPSVYISTPFSVSLILSSILSYPHSVRPIFIPSHPSLPSSFPYLGLTCLSTCHFPSSFAPSADPRVHIIRIHAVNLYCPRVAVPHYPSRPPPHTRGTHTHLLGSANLALLNANTGGRT